MRGCRRADQLAAGLDARAKERVGRGEKLLAFLPRQGERLLRMCTLAGLHGLHVVIGATLIGVVAILTSKGKITSERYTLLENSALYWHLVDLVWIFVFPLYYLIL